MNTSQTSVYVDTDALQKWNAQMSKINEEAITTLGNYLTTVNQLENYMLGNVASGFINDTNEIMKKSKNCHEQMKDVEKFLLTVVNTMNNQ